MLERPQEFSEFCGALDDPNEVFIYLEYPSLEDANEARARLVSSGVLDRFEDKHGPNVLVDAG